jgi:predicted 2-oxoglutarate/Fe(II)-dependent dioxygenase YbiX
LTARATPLAVGEPAPWFAARTRRRGQFFFHTVAGRPIVLAFLGPLDEPRTAAFLGALRRRRELFDDERLSFFGVCSRPEDERHPQAADSVPGVRFFWDFERRLAALYGVREGPYAYVLDPALRVLAAFEDAQALLALLEALPAPPAPAPAAAQAPVLVLPRIFEPGLCERLVDYYDRRGGEDLGFVQDIDGKTRRVIDHGHKRRGDRELDEEPLRRACRERIARRLLPIVERCYGLRITRMERYLVSCYEPGGHFAPHRDNTTRGTAHRQLAVSLFLNTGQYEGGHLRFPEYGNALYGAPAGGAVVFSCSLLHAATPVRAGRRMMFLPFLYDDASAQVRAENERHLDVATALRAVNAGMT